MSDADMSQQRVGWIENWLNCVQNRTHADYSDNACVMVQSSAHALDDEDSASDDGGALTPRLHGRPLRTSHRSLSPSAASTASSSTKPRSSRRAGPVNNWQVLRGLEKPVWFNELYAPSEQLPEDVQALYSRIRKMSYCRSAYLPLEDRESLCLAVGDEIPDYSFKSPASPPPAGAKSDLDELQEILFTFHECRKLDRSELAVSMLVYAPLLKLALKNHHYVDEELMQSARICMPFVPTLADIGVKDKRFTKGKMVDLALVLTPAQDGSRALRRPFQGGKRDTAADECLLRAIQTQVLHREPLESQTVNQTAYTPVMFRPIAISIKSGGGLAEGKLRLGI